MDSKHPGDVLKHLEKQEELLTDSCKSMSHESHKLQVEEEMLMRKYYEFMAAQDLVHNKGQSLQMMSTNMQKQNYTVSKEEEDEK